MTTTVHSVKFNQKDYLENLNLNDYDLIMDVKVELYLNTVTDYTIKPFVKGTLERTKR